MFLPCIVIFNRSRSAGEKVVVAVCGSLFAASEAREFLFR